MEKYNNWKLKFYTIWAGQAVSLITSAILQMAIIFYLTAKTGSAMVLSMVLNRKLNTSKNKIKLQNKIINRWNIMPL